MRLKQRVAADVNSLKMVSADFAGVVGLYIAAPAVMWQVVSFIAFATIPGWPIIVGSVLIVAGDSLIAFWRP